MNEERPTIANRHHLTLVSVVILGLFFAISIYLRGYFPYQQVFSGEWIKYTGVDAYYHMRLVDSLVHNFPHGISFDPYISYPFGYAAGQVSFFDWLLAGIIRVVSLGSPTEHTIDIVAVFFPVILAALTLIPVYFIGRTLFGHWAGVLAAGLIAIMPGEFMGRSILGFTDHHVAETLFAATAMMFLILAIKVSRERMITFKLLWCRDWATVRRPVIYGLLGGLFLAIYLLTWIGGLLFAFIVTAYFITQIVINHVRRRPTEYLALVGTTFMLAATIIYAPFWFEAYYLAPLAIALFIPIVLHLLSQWMIKKGVKPGWYPSILIALGLLGGGIFYAIFPSLSASLLRSFNIFDFWSGPRTIMEMQPILNPSGSFTLSLVWGNFSTGFFITIIVLGFLVYHVIKQGSAEKSLILLWSVVILLAMIGQRRFAYYFALNVAVLTGYASWEFIKRAISRSQGLGRARAYLNTALAVIIVFIIVFSINIIPAISIARQAKFAPSDAWCSSLTWLKDNTPEPFGNPDFYYQRYQLPPSGESYRYPESAYGVTAWVDYGYWIVRIGHRPTTRTPGPGGTDIAQLFLAQDEDSASIMSRKLDSNYIIIDHLTVLQKFWSLAHWAEMERAHFYDRYFEQEEDKLVGAMYYHPEYYRSLMVRLYNFDGKEVTPETTRVIAYEDKMVPNYGPVHIITDDREFSSYQEAADYVSSQKTSNYRIVSDSPFVSPVPLSALKYYKLVHQSGSIGLEAFDIILPEVKIFQYSRD